MRTKHVFVSVLDIAEILPFCISEQKDVRKAITEQERCMKELDKFVTSLEKNYKEGVFSIGFDIIGEKYLQRFIFEEEGFLELMIQAPVAIAAHFVHEKKAEKFVGALRKTLREILPKSAAKELMIENIEVQKEDEVLTHEKWQKLKKIREDF